MEHKQEQREQHSTLHKTKNKTPHTRIVHSIHIVRTGAAGWAGEEGCPERGVNLAPALGGRGGVEGVGEDAAESAAETAAAETAAADARLGD